MTCQSCKGKIVKTILCSPIGELEIKCCPKGIVSLQTVSKKILPNDFHPNKSGGVRVKRGSVPVDHNTQQTMTWLQTYFSIPHLTKSLPIPPICHLAALTEPLSFTQKVWKTLTTEVPFGSTISYGNLAIKSGGKVTASRAVGQAMRNNPVSIIVPCHRVILSSGLTGNYSGGDKNCVKTWLIEHEQC